MKKWFALVLLSFILSGCTLAEFFCIRNYTNQPMQISFPEKSFHHGFQIEIKNWLLTENEIKSDSFLRYFKTWKKSVKNNRVEFTVPAQSTVYLERFKINFKGMKINTLTPGKDYQKIKARKEVYKPSFMSVVYCLDLKMKKDEE